jgi:S-adenosylmethionine uptake transporter
MALSPTLSGAGLGLLAFGAYAAYDISAKVLGAAYHPLQIIFAAGALTLPLLGLYILYTRSARRLWPTRPGLMALRCAGTVVNFIAGVSAFTMLPLAEAYVIFFTMPLFIALLAVPVLGERFDPVRGIAVLIGLAGVIVALDPVATPLGLGHALALTGALVGAMNYVLIRKTGAVENTAVMLLWPQLVLFAIVAAAMPWVYRPMPAADLGISALMAGVLMIGMVAVVEAYRRAAAIIVAPMQYSQILWAAIFGSLLFGEAFDTRTLIGSLLIALAGIIVVARQDKAAGVTPPTTPT